MTIRRIDPDEAFTINGVQVTGRTLAEARQELSHRGVYNPRWAELTEQEQETAALAAGSYLRSIAELAPDLREWLAGQFDEGLVATVAVAIEGEGSGCDHTDGVSCSTCLARTAVDAVARALRAALDETCVSAALNPLDVVRDGGPQ